MRNKSSNSINWAITPATQQRDQTLRDMLSGVKKPMWDNAAYGDTPQDDIKARNMASMANSFSPGQITTVPISDYQRSNAGAVGQGYGMVAREMNKDTIQKYAEQVGQIQQQKEEQRNIISGMAQDAMKAKLAQAQAIADAERQKKNSDNLNNWIAVYNPGFNGR